MAVMSNYKYFENSNQRIIQLALLPIVLALALIPLAYRLTLESPMWTWLLTADVRYTDAALFLTHSANLTGAVLIACFLLVIFATRRRLSSRYRLAEALAIAGTALVFAGGGALVNENFVKEHLKTPRPNIEWLTTSAGGSALEYPASLFYEAGDKLARKQKLQEALKLAPAELGQKIKAHWLDETGYSFPSGHSYSAFLLTTLFLFLAVTFLEPKRRLVFYLLLPWAVLVAYSRVALMVHTPLDIFAGACTGVLFGVLAWFIARAIIRVLARSPLST